MSWQSAFADNTTNIAFCLRLTKAQVAAMRLAYMYHIGGDVYNASDNVRSVRGIDQGVPAMKNLRERGLIEHHPVTGHPLNHRWYTLTPAGILVYDVLALAGLLQARNEAEQPTKLSGAGCRSGHDE